MTIPIVRTWTNDEAPKRPVIDDDLPKVYLTLCDYRPLLEYSATGVINLDWDIAVDRYDLDSFAAHAEADPERVRIAPYRLRGFPRHWATQRGVSVPFGIVYLPPWCLKEWEPLPSDRRMTDGNFSRWLDTKGPHHQLVVIENIPVVHLH